VAALVAVAFLLPTQFMGTLWTDNAPSLQIRHAVLPAAPSVPAAKPAQPTPAPAAPPVSAAPASAQPVASKSVGDIVSNTFQTLYAGPNGPSLDKPDSSAPAQGAPAPANVAAQPPAAAQPAPADKGVVTRVVNTVVIHADPTTGSIQPPAATPAPVTAAASQPMPVPLAPLPARSAAPQPMPVPLAPPPPATAAPAAASTPAVAATTSAAPIAATPAADAASAAQPAATAAPAPVTPASPHEQIAVVGGEGITVRAGPATARSALFSLPAGQKLSVIGKQHNWLHVTDAKGRAGWVYSGLVRIR